MSKHHPGFNNHPSVSKGEGHSKPAEGHAGIDKGMHPGGMKPGAMAATPKHPQAGITPTAGFPSGKMPKGGGC